MLRKRFLKALQKPWIWRLNRSQGLRVRCLRRKARFRNSSKENLILNEKSWGYRLWNW